jgi:quinolinate synthase
MKRISLPKILRSLETMQFEVTIDPAIIKRARAPIERMIALPVKRQSMYNHQHKPEVAGVEQRA